MSTATTAAEGADMARDDAVVTESRIRRFTPRGVLGLTMLFTGAAGLIYEYELSTVFSYLLGSSVEQFSLTIGLMMLFMGIGGMVQRGIKKPLVECFVGAELLLVLLGGFSPIALQWAFVALPTDFFWLKLLYPAAIGLLIGVEIPLAMKINERYTANLGSNISNTWAWDYIGSFLGVLLWLEMLRRFVPLTHLSYFVAAGNLFVALLTLIYFWRKGLLRWRFNGHILVVLGALVTAVTLLGVTHVDNWSRLLSQQMYEDPIYLNVNTKFQNIVITKGPHPSNPQDNNWQLFLNGNKQFASADEAIYHEYLVHPAMNLAARRNHVLILGGGDGMAMREVLKYKDVTDVTLVDLDPGMVELAQQDAILKRLNGNSFADARVHSSINGGAKETGEKRDVWLPTGEMITLKGSPEQRCEKIERSQKDDTKLVEADAEGDCTQAEVYQRTATVNVYTVDADRFIADRPGYYDVVIADLPDPNSIELSKLYSKEFYEKVKRVLSPDGITVVQSTSPYHAKETFLCIMRTMAAAGLNVLPYHDNVPSFGDWGWILASPTVKADSLRERATALDAFGVETREVMADNMMRALVFNKNGLRANSAEISTLMRPVVFDYYLHEAWKTD